MIIDPTLIQSPLAETTYRSELQFLAHFDRGPRPPGWLLSPRAVVTFLRGSGGETLRLDSSSMDDDEVPEEISREIIIDEKFVGERGVLERIVAILAGGRALLLIGEPGTGKSMLAELLAAAISRTSSLSVQGTIGTTEEQLRYGWHHASLLSRGPSREALVPSPVLTAMRRGAVARVEDLARCRPEVQDALVSILAERRLAVPELDGHLELAAVGFNVIATANLRDGAVPAMSGALQRRFHVETVAPIADPVRERELVRKQVGAALARVGEPRQVDETVLDVVVTAFRDLRAGRSVEGWAVDKPVSAMSTAEAVSMATSLGLHASYFAGAEAEDLLLPIPSLLLAMVLKEAPQERERLLAYWDGAVKQRADAKLRPWMKLFELRAVLTAT